MSHRVAPILGVIVRPAWETIAEQTLPRSLPVVVYALKGCLPETGIYLLVCDNSKRKILKLTD